MSDPITKHGTATISPCGKFRYRLSRAWDASLPQVCFIMLNPSKADALINDPTIVKCVGFADRLGYGSMVVVNLFAYRATDPKDLKRASYPVGPDNDEAITDAVLSSRTIICAWGVNARKLARPAAVIANIKSCGMGLHALKLTADGVPWHPLMLPYTSQLVDML